MILGFTVMNEVRMRAGGEGPRTREELRSVRGVNAVRGAAVPAAHPAIHPLHFQRVRCLHPGKEKYTVSICC